MIHQNLTLLRKAAVGLWLIAAGATTNLLAREPVMAGNFPLPPKTTPAPPTGPKPTTRRPSQKKSARKPATTPKADIPNWADRAATLAGTLGLTLGLNELYKKFFTTEKPPIATNPANTNSQQISNLQQQLKNIEDQFVKLEQANQEENLAHQEIIRYVQALSNQLAKGGDTQKRLLELQERLKKALDDHARERQLLLENIKILRDHIKLVNYKASREWPKTVGQPPIVLSSAPTPPPALAPIPTRTPTPPVPTRTPPPAPAPVPTPRAAPAPAAAPVPVPTAY